MLKRLAIMVVALSATCTLTTGAAAQDKSDNQSTTFCTFEDGNEVSVRFQPLEYNRKNEPPAGKPWAPNGTPILLFTPTNLTVGNSTVPTGAYTVYTVKNRSDWTLIINKNVSQGAAYDSAQDVVRVNMESGKLPNTKPLNITLGHIQPKVCSLQIVFGDTAVWTDLKQQ
ncbi:MAG TPA: DUF2911 domain-containing protein [Terriglobales bacterium]|nr:DUF2911 domain-containing protein [Terriglobales bacterium]